MADYRVMVSCWMEDSSGLSKLRAEGDVIDLTDAQANYLKLTGQVEPVSKRAAAKPAAKEADAPSRRRSKSSDED
ncbi:MAG: hypothetical protein ROR55_21055 [Devosia sp.]